MIDSCLYKKCFLWQRQNWILLIILKHYISYLELYFVYIVPKIWIDIGHLYNTMFLLLANPHSIEIYLLILYSCVQTRSCYRLSYITKYNIGETIKQPHS